MKGRASRSQLNRRGRTALAWALVVFALGQISAAIAIERSYPQFRDPEFGYRRNRLLDRLAHASPRPYTAIMLGSSRTVLGFDAGILERQLSDHLGQPAIAFNFGVTGAGPLTHLLNLKRLLKDNIRPDLVLIEVLPPMLNSQPWNKETLRLTPERLWHDELAFLKDYDCAPGIDERWLSGWPVPFYEHRLPIVSRFLPSWLPYNMRLDWTLGIDDSGYRERPKMPHTAAMEQIYLEKMRQDYCVRLKDFVLGGQACRGLIELVELCQKEHLSAALVLMPEGTPFRGLYKPEVWQQIDDFLHTVAEQAHIPILNAREWLPDSAFFDAHHLRQEAVEDFTSRFGSESVLPLVDRLRPPTLEITRLTSKERR